MGIGMCSQKRLVHPPGLKPASGKYATRATDTDFDNKTNITVLQFLYADTSEGVYGLNPSNAVSFSMWDGTDGFYMLWAGTTQTKEQYFIGKGGSYTPSKNIGNSAGYSWASGDGLIDGICHAWAYTFDASLSENESKIFSYTLKQGKNTASANNSESNLGALGTSTAIRLGNLSTNGSNVSLQMTAGNKIGKTAIWFSTLSEANIEALINYTADGSMIYDVSGRYGAAGYTSLGIAQPNHEWIPMLDGTISDTGSDGGKDLTIVGSAKIATLGAY